MGDDIKILERIIHFTTKRHGVLASNIANVDTPGYKTRDLDFNYILDAEKHELKATDKKHIKNSSSSNLEELKIEALPSWGDSNNVELDMEVAKVTENFMMFMGGTTMLSMKFRMLKEALRR